MPRILFEDNHCLAIDKPAGLLSQGDSGGEESVVEWAKADLKRRYDKPGKVYVGLVHRLDRPVSGVLLLAKTSKAASRLSGQFRAGAVEKVYLAAIEGRPDRDEGDWVDHLRKDESSNVVEVVDPSDPRARMAGLAYKVVGKVAGWSLVELRPRTGRGHQLRVQLASRGLPIVGDKKYGAKSTLRALDGGFRIALHASSLGFRHPTRAEAIELHAPEPADWPGAGDRGTPIGRGTPGGRPGRP